MVYSTLSLILCRPVPTFVLSRHCRTAIRTATSSETIPLRVHIFLAALATAPQTAFDLLPVVDWTQQLNCQPVRSPNVDICLKLPFASVPTAHGVHLEAFFFKVRVNLKRLRRTAWFRIPTIRNSCVPECRYLNQFLLIRIQTC